MMLVRWVPSPVGMWLVFRAHALVSETNPSSNLIINTFIARRLIKSQSSFSVRSDF